MEWTQVIWAEGFDGEASLAFPPRFSWRISKHHVQDVHRQNPMSGIHSYKHTHTHTHTHAHIFSHQPRLRIGLTLGNCTSEGNLSLWERIPLKMASYRTYPACIGLCRTAIREQSFRPKTSHSREHFPHLLYFTIKKTLCLETPESFMESFLIGLIPLCNTCAHNCKINSWIFDLHREYLMEAPKVHKTV